MARIDGGEQRPFRYRTIGTLASIGSHTGVGIVFGISVRGWIAWCSPAAAVHRPAELTRYPPTTMSREERRAYQKMNRNRDPLAPPPLPRETQSRIERARLKRSARRAPASTELGWDGRWRLIMIAGFFVAGLLGLSFTWPSGTPFALWVGLGAAIAWVGLMVVVRLAQRRARRIGLTPRT